MRVAIAGAGNVGRSIALELSTAGYQVLLIDREPDTEEKEDLPAATWHIGDACEVETLERVSLDTYDISIAATGDDKANLVFSLLAKTEFGVPRTVGRVNNPHNEWMFDEMWGVDVAVSTPRIISALVEEAVASGDLVSLLSFGGSTTELAEIRLPDTSPVLGRRLADLELPADVVLVAVIRGKRPSPPDPDLTLADNDQLLFLVAHESRGSLADAFNEPRDQATTS